MALKLIDGFEIYGPAGNTVGINMFNGRYPSVVLQGGSLAVVAGRLGGNAMQFDADSFTTPLFTSQSTWWVGFAFRNNTLPAGNNIILSFMDTTFIQVSLAFNGTTRVFSVINGNGTVLGTGTTVLDTIDFYYIEIKAVIAASTGTVELKINTVDEINLTNQRTQNTGSSNSSANSFVFGSSGVAGQNWVIDDLYIQDNSGSHNFNAFQGDVIVEAISPVATGSNTGWTPTAGSLNFQCAQQRDALQNTTSTVNAIDTYKFGGLARIASGITGISENVFTKNSDSTTHTMCTMSYISGTPYTGTTQTVSSTGYKWLTNIAEVNPSSSVSWTVSDINTSEFGMKLLS